MDLTTILGMVLAVTSISVGDILIRGKSSACFALFIISYCDANGSFLCYDFDTQKDC